MRISKAKSSFIINILFFVSIVFSFVFLALNTFLSSQLKNKLNVSLLTNWTVSDGKNTEDIRVPKDLARDVKYKNLEKIVYKAKISEGIKTFKNPTLVLGRMADSDVVYIDDCYVGSTGIRNDKIFGFWWAGLRSYQIPQSCLDKITKSSMITVFVMSLNVANKGIFGGPIGVGENDEISTLVHFVEFFRFDILFIFGLLLITIGLYYIFVYILVPARSHNGIFGFLSINVGCFLVITSGIFYRYFNHPDLVMKLNFLFGFSSTLLLFAFIQKIFGVLNNKILKGFAFVSVFLLIGSFFGNSISYVFRFYEIWYSVFLICLIYIFTSLLIKSNKSKSKHSWKYLLGLYIFFFCTAYDILTTAFRIDSVYLIYYGFVTLVASSALALANEYADAFLHVEVQVGERTKDLSSALEQLKGLEKMKERFFANVSHDLKTPITIALGAIDDAKLQFKNTIGRVLEPADRSLRRLQEMVMSILDTVKAESGTLTLEWKSVKVVDFLERMLEPYKSLCMREGITLKFSGEGFGGLSVPMDPAKIERVLENLLSNAIKFTKKTTRSQKVIEVSFKTDQSKLYIYIDDSGIGIPAAEREKVFERYFQSSLTNLREHGGSGIGLSFVAEMIALHNGKVSAEESPYQGSRFTIELPLSQSIESIQSYRIEDLGGKALRGSLDVEYPKTVPDAINASQIKYFNSGR
jgi:signal transduction histidine kinase